MIAGGDVCFGRALGQALLRDSSYDPFASVASLFATADLRFVNLESQLSDQGGETQSPRHPLVFTGPPRGADALSRAGIEVVSAANNHMWDYGERAFFETLENLDRVGVSHAGAGKTYGKAHGPVIVEKRGLKIAVLAVTDIWNQGSLWTHRAYNFVAAADIDGLAYEVRRLRSAKKVDAVVVSYHGGAEYLEIPLARTRTIAHAAIDAGADAFIGHHPHVLQGIELWHGKPIFYSLGNFIMRPNVKHPETALGALARIELRRGAPARFELCPVRGEDNGLRAIPLAADEERASTEKAFVERIEKTSSHFRGAPVLGPFGEDGCARLSAKEAETPPIHP